MSLDPYPADTVEHEFESLSSWLRSHDGCPQEVRIRQEEGMFERPMLLVEPLILSSNDGGQYYMTLDRTVNLMWYGSEDVADRHEEKNKALSWLDLTLVRSTDRLRGVIQIYDFSDSANVESTNDWILIDDSTISINPRLDEFNLWTIACSFRYTVERGPRTEPQAVTGVTYSTQIAP